MRSDLNTLLLDSRLRLTTADTLALPAFDRFPIRSGRVHEWFLAGDTPAGGVWYPPLTVMTILACQAAPAESGQRRIVWIGRRCFPTFQLLTAADPAVSAGQALARSVFLDPPTDSERFWAIGQALRCAGVRAVVADASGLSATMSRRLQLAAEGRMVMGFLARPPWEMKEPTHAATRWQVRPCPAAGQHPGWTIELMSCRGQQPEQDALQNWNADWAYQVFRGTGALHLSPGVGHRSAAAQSVSAARRPA